MLKDKEQYFMLYLVSNDVTGMSSVKEEIMWDGRVKKSSVMKGAIS